MCEFFLILFLVTPRILHIGPFFHETLFFFSFFTYTIDAVWPIVDMIFGTYREEPIVYIDGHAELIKPIIQKGKEMAVATEEEHDDSIVYETAEGASKDDALPDIPWYIRPFASLASTSSTTAEHKKKV